ncbi:MAG TPA: GGDEF domain-containing protein [Casimicrobiaceae bacterium]|nr:GGDEF domain-containing protein [Casimicrobiaceae bacterium]
MSRPEPLAELPVPERAGTPSAIARDALRQLAAMRMPPTPDNYARMYYDLAPGNRPATGGALAALREIAGALEAECPESNGAASALNLALDMGDWSRVREIVVGCLQARETSAAHAPKPASGDRAQRVPTREWKQVTEACRALLAESLTTYISAESGFAPDLVEDARTLAREVREAATSGAVKAIEAKLRPLLTRAQRAGHQHRAIQEGLLRLLQLLSSNVSELVGDGSWIRAQVDALTELTQGTVTLKAIAELESALRDIAARQGALKASLEQAKDAMKHMVATFIERIGELASNAGGYHDRLAGYCNEIEGAKDVNQLTSLIVRIMEDTRGVQVDLGRSREELLAARRTVEDFQERTNRLESELMLLSDRLQEDQLTRVLNRRGLNRAFITEAARADRHRRVISLAMIDVDNFKGLNDRFGHQAGDSALVHITETLRASLRTSDLIARYGGEEFVVLLPETDLKQAMQVLQRVQRDLERNPFVHEGQQVPITFSAGVAERVTGESQEALIARADRALYEAKKDGKNRVLPK